MLLMIVGCQPAPAAVPATPPPPMPEPTGEPVVPAKMEDLVGWWKVSSSMDMSLHIEPDGTWGAYNIGTDAMPASQISGATYRGAWSPNEGAWNKTFTAGPVSKNCVGQYDVQVLPGGSLHFIQIVDPCGQGHEDEVFTRATGLEALLCTWNALGEKDATLAFRSDTSYAAWHGTSPETGKVVGGKLLWNDALGRIELRDQVPSPCGAVFIGIYELVLAEDGTMTIECIEDRCEERRKVMTQWGPFQRSDMYAEIAGRYRGVEQPQYELLLSGCGLQRLRSLPDLGEGLLREGSFTVQGQQIEFLDARGEARCKSDYGTYAFTRVDNKLTIEAVEDPCQARKDVFAACATWTRVGDQ